MSFAPLVNWRNFNVNNLKAILEVYPDMTSRMSQDEAKNNIESKLHGYKKTAYQFACQLGLENRQSNLFEIHDYLYTFDDEKLNQYLEFWFKTYIAPNPYVNSDDEPINLFCTISRLVLNNKDLEIDYNDFFQQFLGSPRGDILLNAIKLYGKPLQYKQVNNKNIIFLKEKDSVLLATLIQKIEKKFPVIETFNKDTFFHRYDYKKFCEYYGISHTIITKPIKDNLKVDSTKLNRIIFGAPGTGKSYRLENDRIQYFGNYYERVTFHPNYSYAQFVGTYKPKPKKKKDKSGNQIDYISYEFVPGPFLRIWINAQKNKNINYLLVIEEINRSNAAAVFGDVFQLLDRTVDGTSEYSINTSEEMQYYLVNEQGFDQSEVKKIFIPRNMYIWATMNSADQGVLPMDSAFKRRWNFEYVGINEDQDAIVGKKISLRPYGAIEWNMLRIKINNRLTQLDQNVKEDKLIGPFFLNENELNSDFIDNIFKNKLLMYLFEDVLRNRSGKLFRVDLNTFSKIISAYDNGENIFDFEILKSVSVPSESASDSKASTGFTAAEETEKYSAERSPL